MCPKRQMVAQWILGSRRYRTERGETEGGWRASTAAGHRTDSKEDKLVETGGLDIDRFESSFEVKDGFRMDLAHPRLRHFQRLTDLFHRQLLEIVQ